jgi:malonyl CoA-acyl carrier protein transacylase
MTETASDLALLFPGQGAAEPAMRELVAEHRPDLLALVTELVGEDPFPRLDEGTRFAQPAIYCAALAGFESLGRPSAGLYAGHSLGEITALAASGALAEADGLRAVVARGRLMDEAGARELGGMVAVGGERERAAELAQRSGLELANENSPGQFVLSGSVEGLGRALEQARSLGLRAKRLPVAGAFHSLAMAPAAEPFRAELEAIEFRPTGATVISCVSAEPFSDDPRELLVAALTSPVRWADVLRRLEAAGARRFLDLGPGKVLAGLARRTLDGADVRTRGDAQTGGS